MSKYIELAKKIKALAEKGIDGEKENAEKLLQNLMRKHNISIEDLEDEKSEMFYFKIESYSHDLEFKILNQLTGIFNLKLFGMFPPKIIRELKLPGNYGVECTKVIYIEIKAKFDFYCKSLEKRLDEFFYAFCIKNDLLVPEGENDKDKMLTPEEKKTMLNALKISKNLESDIFLKQLE